MVLYKTRSCGAPGVGGLRMFWAAEAVVRRVNYVVA